MEIENKNPAPRVKSINHKKKINNKKNNNRYNSIDRKNINLKNKYKSNNISSLDILRKKYLKEIKFLFNLYSHEKNFLNNINEKNGKKFYAIDKSWLDNFKLYYEYDILKYILIKNNYNNFEEAISKFPEDYLNIIHKKLKQNDNSHKYKELTKIIQHKKYKILIEYTVINYDIVDFINEEEKAEVEINKIDDNKFLLLFKDYRNNNRILDKFRYFNIVLGYFDNNNCFMPQYLFDYNKNNIDKLISLIKGNNFLNFFQKKDSNSYFLNPGYCFKIRDEISYKDSIMALDIISLYKNNNSNFDSYTCINCSSEIELTNIIICNDDLNQEDIIEFNCKNCANKKYRKNLKEYLENMIYNQYLFNKCCICGTFQFDKKEKIYDYCIECKGIFCGDEKCLLFHKCNGGYITNIIKKNYICLNKNHFRKYNGESYYTNYCEENKNNLCNDCYLEGGHASHKSDNIILKYNNTKEELDILYKIIEGLEKKQKEIFDKKLKEFKKIIDKDIQVLKLNHSKEIEKYENSKKVDLEKIDKEIIEIQKKEINEYIKKIQEEINKYNDKMGLLLNQKDENFSNNNVNYNFNLAKNFIKSSYDISEEYIDLILDNKKFYDSKLEKIKNEYTVKREKINEDYRREIEKSENLYLKNVNCYKNKFENEKKKSYEEINNPMINKIEYQIIFIKTIINTYKFKENSNYYYSKNLFKLLLYFYNKEDSEFFKNIVKNEKIEKIREMKNEIDRIDNNKNIISNNINKELINEEGIKGQKLDIAINIPKIGREIDIKGPKIGLSNADIDRNRGLDIKDPKVLIKNEDFDINAPKIGGGLDIKGQKIDVDIKEPKLLGIGVDIKETSISKPDSNIRLPGIVIHGPKIDEGIDIPEPKKTEIDVDIKGPKISGVEIIEPKIDAGSDNNKIISPKSILNEKKINTYNNINQNDNNEIIKNNIIISNNNNPINSGNNINIKDKNLNFDNNDNIINENNKINKGIEKSNENINIDIDSKKNNNEIYRNNEGEDKNNNNLNSFSNNFINNRNNLKFKSFNEGKIIEYDYKLMNENINELIKETSINEDVTIELFIKNNFDAIWPPDGRAKLIFDDKSDFKFTTILLKNLKKDEFQYIKFDCPIKDANPGNKTIILHFNVDGKNYGEPIILKININENIVDKFRTEYNLSKEDYSDEMILNCLKRNKNDFNSTFSSFFN